MPKPNEQHCLPIGRRPDLVHPECPSVQPRHALAVLRVEMTRGNCYEEGRGCLLSAAVFSVVFFCCRLPRVRAALHVCCVASHEMSRGKLFRRQLRFSR